MTWIRIEGQNMMRTFPPSVSAERSINSYDPLPVFGNENEPFPRENLKLLGNYP